MAYETKRLTCYLRIRTYAQSFICLTSIRVYIVGPYLIHRLKPHFKRIVKFGSLLIQFLDYWLVPIWALEFLHIYNSVEHSLLDPLEVKLIALTTVLFLLCLLLLEELLWIRCKQMLHHYFDIPQNCRVHVPLLVEVVVLRHIGVQYWEQCAEVKTFALRNHEYNFYLLLSVLSCVLFKTINSMLSVQYVGDSVIQFVINIALLIHNDRL